MSDVAYIMETQDPKELWLIDGENRFRVSRDMYWLLASNGADLPPTYNIADILAENAKLRELVRKVQHFEGLGCYGCPHEDKCDADTLYDPDCPMREEIKQAMSELGLEVKL